MIDKSTTQHEPELVPLNESAPHVDLTGARVLVVEDYDMNQQILTEFLKQTGISVCVTENGQQAIDAARKEKFDAILMDINMPKVNGFEATQFIRNTLGQTDVPIIAITAYGMHGDREKSFAAGMNDHITKPIEQQILYQCLARWISPQDGFISMALPCPKTTINLPDIMGIDTAKGLAQIGHDEVNYRNILIGFEQRNRKIISDIKQAIERKEFKLAHREAHRIKGFAGLIGATDLSEAATKAEAHLTALIDNNESENRKLILNFLDHLAQVMNGIQIWSQTTAIPDKSMQEAKSRVPKVDQNEFLKLLTALDESLDQDMGKAAALLLKVRVELEDTPTEEKGRLLQNHLNNFDINAAHSIIQELYQDVK